MPDKPFRSREGDLDDPNGAIWIIDGFIGRVTGPYPLVPDEWGFSDTEQGAKLWASRLNRAFELGAKHAAEDGGFGN